MNYTKVEGGALFVHSHYAFGGEEDGLAGKVSFDSILLFPFLLGVGINGDYCFITGPSHDWGTLLFLAYIY